MAPRLVRQRPLAERIRSYLNPWDFLLWLSEEIDGNDWDKMEKDWGLTIGIILNFIFLLARANSRSSGTKAIDDVFGEDERTNYLAWLASITVLTLTLFSVANAVYTFGRKKRYRMFEAPIEQNLASSSAHRVRVDSSPTSSPLRYLANAISTASAQSRAHPDAERDVWEVAMWDPLPICVRLFSLFSPGHVLVYWLFLPTQVSDPRPSVIILTTIFLTTLLSVQMSFFGSSYVQQTKDSNLVHKEVMREYDTKYVHPRTQPLMRDVGTQFSAGEHNQPGSHVKNQVDVYSPAIILNHGFQTSPNPHYLRHVDPEGHTPIRPTRNSTPSQTSIFQVKPSLQTPIIQRDSSPLVRTAANSMRQPQFRPSPTTRGDGGSLGVYSHANSPLRKSASTAFERRTQNNGDFFYRERDSALKRPSSPLKRSSLAVGSPAPSQDRRIPR